MGIQKVVSLLSLSAIFLVNGTPTYAQQKLSLQEALETSMNNFRAIKAKENYAKASNAGITATKREYLPDLNVSVQNSYGTVNGQTGPLYGYKGYSVSSSGPALADQNWNSAFGGIYIANVNWDFFAFGRQKSKEAMSSSQYQRDMADLNQEKFTQQVKVVNAYISLLTAQRLTRSMKANLDRTVSVQEMIQVRTLNGLNAGVDSSIANSEVAKAKLSLLDAQNYELAQNNKLGELMGVSAVQYVLDTSFVSALPKNLLEQNAAQSQHPTLLFFNSRVQLSRSNELYLHKQIMPTFTFFGIAQTRGSGFNSDYGAANLSSYNTGWWDGIHPTRSNYLLGVNVSWGITNLARIKSQVTKQHYNTEAMQNELELAQNQLSNQLTLSQQQIENAMQKYAVVPVQLKAASDAFLQKSTLYENGLANIVDLSQALYNINRADTDRDVVYAAVWQALLFKAAALGDIQVFLSQQ
ncbi:outer membrane protein TolC [Chitinophaga skermanii]|uniref:Outer membrane protein TolC n=1 Tax=Chitinophaga skermanii TaxID=331697 RepID=A0A327Q6G5_9BACT|nr:TolC family protein [Chitinophaga skermanii]RAI97446.1 outer membrane protein TolC [Chitinophaga skermanii]